MSKDAKARPDPGSALTAAQRSTLDAVLNLIVPASADGRMPGAAEVGVPAYLCAEAADALPVLREELDELEQRSRAGEYVVGQTIACDGGVVGTS